jgi:predicted house-cleaning noncanonical NTP pyrophosphatase (MazG superfamily)
MPTYNKLVRDKIPHIIEKNGKRCNVVALDAYEYREQLEIKLREELEEYLAASDADHSLEELADLVEVIHALAEVHGSNSVELEEIRLKKVQERGGFKSRLFLVDVVDE